jgi:hypothetical protein
MKSTLARLLTATALLTVSAAASSISTTFADGNRFDGNMFDVAVGPNGINVNSLDVNVDTGSMTIDVYIKAGTYVGFETTPAAWTLVSATPVSGLGSAS